MMKRIIHRTLIVFIGVFLAVVSHGQTRPSPESSIAGVSFTPEQLWNRQMDASKPEGRKLRASPGLADWELLSTEIQIKAVRFVGFSFFNDRKPIDWTTSEPLVLKTLVETINWSFLKRLPLSDFSNFRSQMGRGAHMGTIVVEHSKGTLVIGVSFVGFYYGTPHGTAHQQFTSWILAKQLDDVLHSQTGRRMDEKYFKQLSGEADIDFQKQAYIDIQAGKPIEEPSLFDE